MRDVRDVREVRDVRDATEAQSTEFNNTIDEDYKQWLIMPRRGIDYPKLGLIA